MPLGELPDATLASVSDAVEYVERYCNLDGLLFRGQQEDWPLTPRLGRLRPRDMSRRQLEERMLSEFIRTAPPHIDIQPANETEWLAVAQHFGMATRLLDWTFNPLAALWFAVQNKPGTGNGVLWVLQSEDLSSSDGKSLFADSVLVVRPRHIVGRIVSQLGMFTLHPFAEDTVLPLERHPQQREALKKLLIQTDSFSEIRWVLDRCGINAATIYPGLDGLCRHLEWAHTFADDEASYVEPAERAM